MKRVIYGESALDYIERNNLGGGDVDGLEWNGVVTRINEGHIRGDDVVTIWYDDVPVEIWDSGLNPDDFLIVNRVEIEPWAPGCE